MNIKLLKETKIFLEKEFKLKPQLSIVTGSGISIFKEYNPIFEIKTGIGEKNCNGVSEYRSVGVEKKTNSLNSDTPSLRHSHTSVPGHEGKLKLYRIKNKDILVFSGRKHLYQGVSLSDVISNVRLSYELGSKKIILTNAAGGINKSFKAGDLMLITGFIDLMQSTERGTLSGIIHPPKMLNTKLNKLIIKKIKTKTGIYAGVLGPSYETYAEIKLLQMLKADAVGMSTVPELICANSLGLDFCGISIISNVWNPKHKPSHKEVLENVSKANNKLEELIFKLI